MDLANKYWECELTKGSEPISWKITFSYKIDCSIKL